MILILSATNDNTTNEVIDWLTFYKKNWLRINETDPIKVELVLKNQTVKVLIETPSQKFRLDDIETYWYRKGNFNFSWKLDEALKTSVFIDQLEYHLKHEISTLQSFLHLLLYKKKGIGNYLTAAPNKLYVLTLAQKAGLEIPETHITNLPNYTLNGGKQWISKAMWEAIHLMKPEYGAIQAYTSALPEGSTTKTHFPSLFQHAIPKNYEVRVFFLDQKCYAMAIFSQMAAKTVLDYRNYNKERPNRVVPYKLPKQLTKKIRNLMNDLKLKSGSIDLIATKNGGYVFLEVNPVGQFGMVSRPCNYPLEQYVANYL